MNAAISNFDDNEFSYRSREKQTKSKEVPNHSRRSSASARRRGKAPEQFNGMHRRRRRKLSW